MKLIKLVFGLLLVMLVSGCDTFRSSSSVFNVTRRSFRVSASFSNAPAREFVQAPETWIDFAVTGRDAPVPLLSQISAHPLDGGRVFSLSTNDIQILRSADKGVVSIVLFDSGFGVAPPGLQRDLKKARNMPDLLQALRQNESKCVEHTGKLLGRSTNP